MTDSLFDIVFRGDVVIGHNIQEVKARLAQLFKTDLAKVEALFSGGMVTLKRNLDAATAEKYKAVLTKAGAQVQVRPVGGAVKPEKVRTQVQPAANPAAENSSPKDTLSENRSPKEQPTASGFSLAPAGASLLDASERQASPSVDLDLSGITVKPMEGDLLEASEKRSYYQADFDTTQFELADPGADLLEGVERENVIAPVIDPDFQVAEAGADLLEPAHRRPPEAVSVQTDHLNVLPLE